MINAIGEATAQQIVRSNYYHDIFEKALAVQKADLARKQRPVEHSDESRKSEMNLQFEENTKTKNNLEDGTIVVEKYDEGGRLIRKIPPGYVPLGEIA
jgi:hypothetical protein